MQWLQCKLSAQNYVLFLDLPLASKIILYMSLLQLNFLLDKNGTNNGFSPLTLLDEKCLVLLIHEFINLKQSCDLENGEEFQSLQGLLGQSLQLFILPGKHEAVQVMLQG